MAGQKNPNTRRSRVFFVGAVLAFGIGFGAGVATIRSIVAPPAEREVALPDTAGLPAATGLGADRLNALVAPPALEREPAPAAAPDGREALEARAAAGEVATAAAVLDTPADGWAARQARLDKAAIRYVPPATEQIVVRRGDTLMNILVGAGIPHSQAYEAVASLRSVYDPRRLRAGQEVVLTAAAEDEADDAARRLVGLAFDLDFDHRIEVTRDGDGAFASAKVERAHESRLVFRAGSIDSSLYLAAERSEVPHDVLDNLIKLFSWDVDFQRDVQRGDAFEALYEELSLTEGERAVRGGDLIFARIVLNAREIDAYRFERPDGTVEYFDRTGRSLRKFLLRTPVDGARLSSGFGMRRHPILGYSRMHKGVDFAAPTGTPIYAAGGGRVESAGRNGGYGNYVRIRHNAEFSTAYAHLSRLARDVERGRRVEQGQVIGYVGTTGRSTGPHLHYEVLKDGSQINPLELKQPPSAQLKDEELEQFRREMARIDRVRRDVRNGTRVAGSRPERTGG